MSEENSATPDAQLCEICKTRPADFLLQNTITAVSEPAQAMLAIAGGAARIVQHVCVHCLRSIGAEANPILEDHGIDIGKKMQARQ